MSSLKRARSLALVLPGAAEQDHHGMASFRVRGRIFATVFDHDHIRIMLDELQIREAVAEYPGICGEVFWGKRLSAVVVALGPADDALLRELLTDAWLAKAPRTLAAEYRQPP